MLPLPCPPPALRTLTLRIDPRRIGYLRFLLEGYDGMALLTTLNAKEGRVMIRYPSAFHDDLTALLDDVAARLSLTHD